MSFLSPGYWSKTGTSSFALVSLRDTNRTQPIKPGCMVTLLNSSTVIMSHKILHQIQFGLNYQLYKWGALGSTDKIKHILNLLLLNDDTVWRWFRRCYRSYSRWLWYYCLRHRRYNCLWCMVRSSRSQIFLRCKFRSSSWSSSSSFAIRFIIIIRRKRSLCLNEEIEISCKYSEIQL